MRQDIEWMPAFPDRTIVFAGRRGAAAVGTTAAAPMRRAMAAINAAVVAASPASPLRINLSSTPARARRRDRCLIQLNRTTQASRMLEQTPALRGSAVRLQFDRSEPRKGKQRAKL
ncbi:hypothetical protein [Paraburkholderia sp. MM5384-R2]|uniref:hypothetical protein n=1 Tax=Paraburkholderia sp. MM5384-R2 TaxID=2723097 RepID=UPI00161E53F7|nr:hypothetical protein [Paraburkholderia sp. MM5384-R2]MBB5496017.1 hypothetical protein [Paraburkholderia sp. MM5384-R2]